MTNQQTLVSVSVIAYNHVDYIEQCLDSIVNQKTNFKFEILIHDDASTDGTSDIIRKFQSRYPDLINELIQSENQYSKGFRNMTMNNITRAKGKYIATLEADDFWIDDYKLQKQFDILEQNCNASVCFTADKFLFPDELSHKNKIHNYDTNGARTKMFNINDVIRLGGGMMHLGSMMFKKEFYHFFKYDYIKISPVGDLPLSLHLALKGDIIYLNEVTSMYRVFAKNNWSSNMRNSFKFNKKITLELIKMWQVFDEFTNYSYTKEINNTIFKHKKSLIKNYIKSIIIKLFKKY